MFAGNYDGRVSTCVVPGFSNRMVDVFIGGGHPVAVETEGVAEKSEGDVIH